MEALGSTRLMRHASMQGVSGIVAPLTDGTFFYDWQAKERYPLAECPAVVLGQAVAPPMVGAILQQMREARVVHLR